MISIYIVFILLFINLLILNKETFDSESPKCKFIPIGDSLENCKNRCLFLNTIDLDNNCTQDTCNHMCLNCNTTKCTWFKDLCSTLSKEGEDSCSEMNFACFWDTNHNRCVKRSGNNDILMNSCELNEILSVSTIIDPHTNNNYLIVNTTLLHDISHFMLLYYNTINSNGINISVINIKNKDNPIHLYFNSNELFYDSDKSEIGKNNKYIINLKKGNYIFYIYYKNNTNCVESNSEEVKVN